MKTSRTFPRQLLIILFISAPYFVTAQYKSRLNKAHWVDSVFNSFSEDEKIAQLMIIRAHSNLGPDHIASVTNDIRKYNVGGLIFFQGGPMRQANLTNFYQGIAKTPLIVSIDGEYGIGMRLDSVTKFPYQLTLGAMNDDNLVYRMGIAVGEQCKRLGIHVNFAPVVDINNNPNNPVIGYRSFGEDKNKVALFGVAYMKGMQDAGIMACAKHFPGHGDVDVDSHFDLPVINKNLQQLDTLELVPFKALIEAGVGMVMIAHLYIPAIDNTANRATSISKKNVTGLLRDQLHFDGLSITDALEMKGVSKFFPDGTISVESLIAGNDLLCLPASVSETIIAVKKAIADKKLSWDDIDAKLKKVLAAKYQLGLNQWSPVNTTNLVNDLNANADAIRREVAEKSIVLLSQAGTKASRTDYAEIPLNKKQKIAYIGLGCSEINAFGKRMQNDLDAEVFLLSYKEGQDKVNAILNKVSKDGKYDAIVIGVHNYSLRTADNFGLSNAALNLYKGLNFIKTITLTFGNVLATKNFCDAWTLAACHQDDDITQNAAADMVEGKIKTVGHLPVTVCQYKFGEGIASSEKDPAKHVLSRMNAVDSIVDDAITQHVFPGCVVMAVHEGEIVYHKAFGHYKYEPSPANTLESIFDVASMTKVSATMLAVMKLYEEGKLDLNKNLGYYLPWAKGSNKAQLQIDDILLHQAGLVSFITFYKETIDPVTGIPNPSLYSERSKPGFTVRVAEKLYLRDDYQDVILDRILKSPLGPRKYVYSDNDFIFLGKIVEEITGVSLNNYVMENFYQPMGMLSTGFRPRDRFPIVRMVPTETETYFRRQTLQGDVHDEATSLFGGVAGHAGLFSDAYDLAMLFQMLLNGGQLNGRRYFKESTIKYFTEYHSKISRRGLGFDKPEKDNAIRRDPYPASLVSSQTFGHTGYTGTCIWADPKYDIVYVFLSNRVYPSRDNNKISQMLIRGKVQDAIYRALGI